MTTKIDGVKRTRTSPGKEEKERHGNDNTRLGGGVLISHNNLSRVIAATIIKIQQDISKEAAGFIPTVCLSVWRMRQNLTRGPAYEAGMKLQSGI